MSDQSMNQSVLFADLSFFVNHEVDGLTKPPYYITSVLCVFRCKDVGDSAGEESASVGT